MKTQLFLISIFCALNANAQDYLITFTGSGASSTVSSVKVENLTAGTSLIVNGNDILHLKSIMTGVNSIKDDQSSKIKIYPNPMSDNSTMEIYAPVAGDAIISVLDITGKPIAQIPSYLENSRQDFSLAGLKTGFYFINVRGKNFQLSEKLLSKGQTGGTISIEKVNVVIQKTEEKAPEKRSKGVQATVDMAYTSGDRLLFTGISGNFKTVKVDIPTSNKTIAFNFISCTDGDNNNYPVVEIGNQVWMAENLKTTKYYDGTVVPLVSDAHTWENSSDAYCWYRNDETTYKEAYGALYNWYAINTEKLCPAGWYQPTTTDWGVLVNYLSNNGYGFGGSGNDIAKSLAASKDWSASSIEEIGSIGNKLADNNSTGFTAPPAGERTSSGEFHYVGDYASWWGSYNKRLLSPFSNTLIGPYMFNRDTFVSTLMNSLASGHSVRCLLGKSLTTTAVTNITQTTAISGGNIKNDAGAPVTGRGVCWSTSPNPTITNNKTNNGTGTGTFTSTISGISANTTYYIRAYATNSLGTIYGDELIFKTFLGNVTDIDGNVYQTVKIGTQIWTAENLKTTKYNDSETIPLVDNNSLISLTTPGYSWYNNDEAYKDTLGALYNSYAARTEKLCPTGWHVPTNAEWTILTDYLTNNGYGYGGSGTYISKSLASPSGWEAYEDIDYAPWLVGNYQSINNSSGFTGIPIYTFMASWWTSSGGEFALFYKQSTPLNIVGDGRGTSPVRCLKGELQVLPLLTTTPISNITSTSATSGGNITYNESTTVTVRGICWSTSPNPTIANNKTTDGSGPGSFTSAITGLIPATTYYARAYATNINVGTAYGNEITFRTTVTDVEGNIYNTVNIGTQVWLIENLKTTRYSNGDLIGTTTSASLDIISETTPKYQWAYNGNESNVGTYGRLYTWFAVNDSRNVCPDHWHVPTQAEWTTLTNYLGGQNISGGKLKEAGTTHWMNPNTGATNESGFTALPGGYRLSSGGFGGLGSDGAWRSSTVNSSNEDWTIGMGNSYTDTYGSNNSKRSGYSVRCIQGDLQVLPIISTTTPNNITQTTAATGGNVTSEGCSPVTEKGVCWSTSPNPTTANNKTINGSGTGTFSSSITGLTANTIYYVRSFATNSYGTNYGNEQNFKTYSGTITDIDGNVYNTIIIGSQTWIAENLRTTKFNDGTSIPLVTNNTDWANLTVSGYCWYDNDEATYKVTYGALYNWYVVDEASNGGKNVCPTGWYVPTEWEWTSLSNYLTNNGYGYGGSGSEVAKSMAAKTGWTSSSIVGSPGNDQTFNNSSGFSALASGTRIISGGYYDIGINDYWWSAAADYASTAYSHNLSYDYTGLNTGSSSKQYGFSVRCVKGGPTGGIIPTNGLVAYYPFNENVNDESGFGNTQTASISYTSDRFGRANKAANFSGRESYISINNASHLNPSEISISLWVYYHGGTHYPRIFSKYYSATNSDTYQLMHDGTSAKIRIGIDGNDSYLLNEDFLLNQWVHLVLIRSLDHIKLYINGQEKYSQFKPGYLLGNPGNLVLGCNGNSTIDNIDHFIGKIDQFRIYNRVLTLEEISALYNEK